MSFSWLLEFPDFLVKLVELVKLLSPIQARFRGDPYEVLENEIELELVDIKGQVAKFSKRKKLRFLQNNSFAYLDTAFGNGKILEDYQCSPGKAVDFYEDGDRHCILITLRKMRKRGDVEEFHISRSIRGGYKERNCYLQTDITNYTHQLEVRLNFPAKRTPKTIHLIEKNTHNTQALGAENIKFLADGRCLVTWSKKHPRLHESYILSWQW
jgi:hypothetical protein